MLCKLLWLLLFPLGLTFGSESIPRFIPFSPIDSVKTAIDELQYSTAAPALSKALMYRTEKNYDNAIKEMRKALKKIAKEKNPRDISIVTLLLGSLYQEKLRHQYHIVKSEIVNHTTYIDMRNGIHAYQECVKSNQHPYAAMAYVASLLTSYDLAISSYSSMPQDNSDESIATRITQYSRLSKQLTDVLHFPAPNFRGALIDYQRSLVNDYPSYRNLFLEIAYFRAQFLEKGGFEYLNAPIPKGLTSEETELYRAELYKLGCQMLSEAVVLYRELLTMAEALNGQRSDWIYKSKEKIEICEEYSPCN